MAEPFKNLFNLDVIASVGLHVARASAELGAEFDEAGFREMAGHDLDALELKERSAQIEAALAAHLPDDFLLASAVLGASMHAEMDADLSDVRTDGEGIKGIALMPVADFVAHHGQDHVEPSLALLKEITKRSTSEFAIRPFLVQHQERTLAVLGEWAGDPNQHVRRLVSEGSRPRLPWGMRLSAFVEDPSPILPLLEALKDDPEEYVRRSVANNLNDIAKDHPDLVAKIAARWLKGASKERSKLVRHACRSLVKQGHEATLAALGYGPPKVTLSELKVTTPTVEFGEKLVFDVALRSDAKKEQNLIVDYVIHHRKANGETSPKVFKWKTITLAAGKTHKATRRHAIKPITTRKYYEGTHFLELQVNGQVMGRQSFELTLP
jgi:3-methyladenine DNA glycosylase AlkC